jgi:hypothetical protein
MYYIFIENEKINGCGQCPITNEEIKNFEVSKEIFNEFIKDTDKYIWNGENVIENPNYDKLKENQAKEARIEEITILLKELDEKRIRAVCEDEIKDETTNETWLDYYNGQIYELRTELNSLKQQI